MKEDFSVRGVRDLYPEVYAGLRYMFETWRKTALRYGFEEFEGPILETLQLYKIKSGEEIVSQLYNFTDRGGRELALRPELTPTLARMVARVQAQVPKPIKWFSIPRCLRYEKPQRGRLREFFQFNVDIIGETDELADLEVISLAVDSLANLGLGCEDFAVKINNRDFASGYFETLNIPDEKISALYKIIDNARKAPQEQTNRKIDQMNLQNFQKEAVHRYLSLSGTEALQKVDFSNTGKESLVRIFSLINDAGLGKYCEFDPTIVRGLDYYTGIVFEIYDKSEEMRAICGGGRYNNLLQEFSGVQVPACGFGMGDVVLGETLAAKCLLPEAGKSIDYYLVRISDQELPVLLKSARSLRNRGRSVEYSCRNEPVKKQMSRASRAGAQKALIFGSDEISRGRVTQKDLATGQETEVELSSILDK
ncbi:MAG: histidine--tRNA ligase [Spirochaetota bacterium]